MLYEVALTAGVFDRFPAAVDPVAGQALVRVLFDVRRTGFLANLYNGSWWGDVSKRCNRLAPSVRGVILDLLKQLHDRGQIIERKKHLPSCPRTDSEWLDEAITSHIAAELYAIITRKASLSSRTGAPVCVLALEEVLMDAYWNSRATSRRVARTAASFSQVLTPLLATSRSIQLIDAQIGFRTYRGNREFLRGLSIIDASAAPPDRRVHLSLCEIHTRDDGTIPNADYRRVAQEIGKAMPRIQSACKTRRLYIWKERNKGKHFHNRRILTNQAIVSVPWGLDIHEVPGEESGDDEWSLLDEAVGVEISKDFQQNSSPYDLAIPPIPW